MPVIAAPDARDGKAKTFVQTSCDFVRAADLERRAARAGAASLSEDPAENLRRDPLPSILGEHREVIDVKLVDDSPESAESDDAAVGILRDEEIRHTGILELREVHLARPWVEERRLLDREQTAQILIRRHGFDDDGHVCLISVQASEL